MDLTNFYIKHLDSIKLSVLYSQKAAYVFLPTPFLFYPKFKLSSNSHRDAWCIINNFFRLSVSAVNPNHLLPPSAIINSSL